MGSSYHVRRHPPRVISIPQFFRLKGLTAGRNSGRERMIQGKTCNCMGLPETLPVKPGKTGQSYAVTLLSLDNIPLTSPASTKKIAAEVMTQLLAELCVWLNGQSLSPRCSRTQDAKRLDEKGAGAYYPSTGGRERMKRPECGES